ncbi:hypothetical protein FRB95_002795 [Tulasnella sp. JGI-2019a]|nr:hypothetical protein FRB95_002795 [Tulasnella sp. JGI-2019a]
MVVTAAYQHEAALISATDHKKNLDLVLHFKAQVENRIHSCWMAHVAHSLESCITEECDLLDSLLSDGMHNIKEPSLPSQSALVVMPQTTSNCQPSQNDGVRAKLRNRDWKYTPPKDSHPYAKDNTVKSRRKPQYPCRACRSEFHFDNNCPWYIEFKARKMVTAIATDVERPDNVQRHYNLDYALSEHGATFDDLEVETRTILNIHYKNQPTLPGQFIDREANSFYSALDYGTFHDQGPDEHFLAKWPKNTLDKSALSVFIEEELVNEGMDPEAVIDGAVSTEESQGKRTTKESLKSKSRQ